MYHLVIMMMKEVTEYFGGQRLLGKVLSPPVSQQCVNSTMRRSRWPAEWVLAICIASKGHFRPHQLRPDLYPDAEYQPYKELV